MSINAGYFPPYGGRRKHTTAAAYNFPLNNQQQQQQHARALPSAHSSNGSANGNEPFFPVISSAVGSTENHRPYRRNDFANNHLFIAKSKLARVFLGQPPRNLQATSDLIHLFDRHEPKRKNRRVNKTNRQENNSNKSTPVEQEVHLSVVDLIMRPPHPSKQTRDPLSALLRNRRSQAINTSAKTRDTTTDTTNPLNKQTAVSASAHIGGSDTTEIVELVHNDRKSDSLVTTANPLYSSLLCVKPIIPSAGPHHTNQHLLQHR